MSEPTFREMMFYGDLGFLYLYDIRYDPHSRAHCNPLPDGRVQFRLHTEPGFSGAQIVFNDGEIRAAPLDKYASDHRFDYWNVIIKPQQPVMHYSFAFKRGDALARSYYHGGRGLTHAVETRFTLDLTEQKPFETPEWMQSAVMYQIFPERFANGDPAISPTKYLAEWGETPQPYHFQGGDLIGITNHIDYIASLGINCLYLNPINTSPSNHKYDAADFYHVDPAFGGDEALRDLVTACHERDMRIILDASFNHCHPQFFAFQDLVKHGEKSRYKDWFTVYEHPPKIRLRPHLLTPEQKENPRFQRYWDWVLRFEEIGGVPVAIVEDDDGPLVDPTYQAWYGVINMPKINQNNPETRAYFLNVAAYWLREFDIDGWRMDVAQFIQDDFWQDFRDVCKDAKPDSVLLSEIWGDTAHWLQGDMFDGTMNYLFRELCIEYFASGKLGTHELMEGIIRLQALYAPQVTAIHQNLLSSHDVPRFLNVANEDKNRFKLASLFQLTMPGAPSIYYGDEIGLTGGSDPDNRRAFPWENEAAWDQDMLQFMTDIIHLRRNNVALCVGEWRWLWDDMDAFAFERVTDEQRVVVLINRGGDISNLAVPLTRGEKAAGLWGETAGEIRDNQLLIKQFPAQSGAVWEIT